MAWEIINEHRKPKATLYEITGSKRAKPMAQKLYGHLIDQAKVNPVEQCLEIHVPSIHSHTFSCNSLIIYEICRIIRNIKLLLVPVKTIRR